MYIYASQVCRGSDDVLARTHVSHVPRLDSSANSALLLWFLGLLQSEQHSVLSDRTQRALMMRHRSIGPPGYINKSLSTWTRSRPRCRPRDCYVHGE